MNEKINTENADDKNIAYRLFTGDLTRIELRHKIVLLQMALEVFQRKYHLPPLHLPLKHAFGDSVYVREVFIPKGSFLVGKIHRHAHANFISQGSVIVVTEHAGVEKLEAPCTMISPKNTKRAVYANEDTIWTTIHVTDERELEKIEEEVIAKSYAEIGEIDPVIFEEEVSAIVLILESGFEKLSLETNKLKEVEI